MAADPLSAVPGVRPPPRAVGSIRRTSSLDVLPSDGTEGPFTLVGRARDLVTDQDDSSRTVAVAEVRAEIDREHRLTSIWTQPHHPGVDRLMGHDARRGLRGRLRREAPEVVPLLRLLLEDIPVGLLLTNYGRVRAGQPFRGSSPSTKVDICAGFRRGGTMQTTVARTGKRPRLPTPPAPSVVTPDDPVGWHELPRLAPYGLRRLRRLDVAVGTVIEVEAAFRDSNRGADGEEVVIHEYGSRATVNPDTWHVTAARAFPHALPYAECPLAAESARSVIGRSLNGLRDDVRRQLRGPDSCTHLTDLLATLGDVRELVSSLPSRPSDSAGARQADPLGWP